ncbi:MAG TPA: LysR family transcriptional regulator [Gammaproteobacteria bacterium]
MDLGALAAFDLVASEGGFGKASRVSGRPKATLSRQVMALEESLGVRLFERGSRTLRLTDEGRALHERTHALLAEIVDVGQCLTEGSFRPRGRLRVSAPVQVGNPTLGRLAAEFVRRYPEVQLEIVAEDRYVDLVAEGYDVVIRANPRPDATLVGRRFARDEMLVVAPPGFPRPRPGPSGAAVRVPAIGMSQSGDNGPWRLGDGVEIVPDVRLRLSSLLMIRDAVRAGAGVALLPRSVIAADAEAGAVEIWSREPQRTSELWVLHTSRRLVSTKITAFVSFLLESFPDGTLSLKEPAESSGALAAEVE